MASRREIHKVFGRKAFGAVGGPMLAAALIVYFGLNAFQGDHGVLRMIEMRGDIARAERLLQTAVERHAHLEARIRALRSDHLDPDYLDERARLMTGLMEPDDIVLSGLKVPDAARKVRAMLASPPGYLR